MDSSEASNLQHHTFEVPERRAAPGVVIARVENLIASLLDDLIEGQELYPPVPVSIKLGATSSSHLRSTEAAQPGQPATTSSVSFPGKSHQQSRKIGKYVRLGSEYSCSGTWSTYQGQCNIARLLKILQLSHAALVTGTIVTKRLDAGVAHNSRSMC